MTNKFFPIFVNFLSFSVFVIFLSFHLHVHMHSGFVLYGTCMHGILASVFILYFHAYMYTYTHIAQWLILRKSIIHITHLLINVCV